MPTEKFFNLKEGKRQAILEAAGDELLETPYAFLTVSRIIQRAGISRASFYYYFNDKEDLFRHLIDEMKSHFLTVIRNALHQQKGNFYESFKLVLSRMLEDGNLEKQCQLYQRMIEDTECHNQAVRREAAFYESEGLKTFARSCQNLLDSSLYPGLDEDKTGCLMEMGVLVLIKTLFLYFMGTESKECLERMAGRQLEILDRGARAMSAGDEKKQFTA